MTLQIYLTKNKDFPKKWIEQQHQLTGPISYHCPISNQKSRRLPLDKMPREPHVKGGEMYKGPVGPNTIFSVFFSMKNFHALQILACRQDKSGLIEKVS